MYWSGDNNEAAGGDVAAGAAEVCNLDKVDDPDLSEEYSLVYLVA